MVNEAGDDYLVWDENVERSLPKQFWRAKLRMRRQGRAEPRTVDEAQSWREEETVAAAISSTKQRRAPNCGEAVAEDDEALAESHRRTDALLQVRAPPLAPRATLSTSGAQDLARSGCSGNVLDRTLASASFQADAKLLAAHPSELSSPLLALADVMARSAVANAGTSREVQRQGLDAAHAGTPSPADLCRQPTGDAALEELRSLPPFLRHFIWRFVSLNYRPPSKRSSQAAALYAQPNAAGKWHFSQLET